MAKKMSPALVIALVNGVATLISVLPEIIEAVRSANLPDQEKEALIARIRKAQESIPEWE